MQTSAKVSLTICVWGILFLMVVLIFDSLAPYTLHIIKAWRRCRHFSFNKATLKDWGTELETADLGRIAHFSNSEVLHMKCQSF